MTPEYSTNKRFGLAVPILSNVAASILVPELLSGSKMVRMPI